MRIIRGVELLVVCAFLSANVYGQSISGRITDRVSGVPLVGIDLDVFDLSASSVNIGSASSDSSGNYTVDVPGAGQYIVRADASAADGVADQYYGNVLLKSQAVPVSVGANQDRTGINISLPRGVLLSGKVTAATGGAALSGIDMNIYASNGEFMSSYDAATLVDGSYALGAVPPGNYFVAANPDATLGQLYLETFYGGSNVIETATPISVSSVNKPNLNIVLDAGGSVTGTVQDAVTGNPIEGVDIDVYDATGALMRSNGKTDLQGTYFIDPVPAGDYYVRIDPTLDMGYAMTFYPSGLSVGSALTVHVTVGNILNNINIVAPRSGSISGTVRRSDTLAALSGINLDVFDATGGRVDLTFKTDAAGGYVLGPVPAGAYVVRADPTLAQGFARTYFPNALARVMATPVDVAAGADTSNINFDLVVAGTISGTIRRASNSAVLAAVDLDAFDMLGNRIDFSAKTDALGEYILGPFPPGNFIVRADPDIDTGLAQQCYDHQIGVNFGDPVSVAANADTPSIDFDLVQAGSISGVIRSAGGTQLASIDLDIFEASSGTRLRASATSAANGAYTFDRLSPGSYVLRADPIPGQHYAMEYYINQLNKAFANPVSVTGGSATNAIDFSLDPGTEVSGKITDAVTGAPVGGVRIEVSLADSLVELDQTASTATNGTYTVPGLPLNALLVAADPFSTTFYRKTYYPASATTDNATVLNVTSITPLIGIDIAMPSAAATLRDDFAGLDAAGTQNNRLSYAEALAGIPTLTSTQFNALDLNHDGSLTMDELLAASSGNVGTADSVWVDKTFTGNELGTATHPFTTIFEGTTFVAPNGVVNVLGTPYRENLRLSTPLKIQSAGGIVAIGTTP